MSGHTVGRTRGWWLLLGVAVTLALPSVAQANTLTVTNTNDSGAGSLRDAITNSAAGDTVNFDPSLNGQTITLTSSPLLISHSLVITGPGASLLTIRGTGNDTVFDVVANSASDDVTISGVTITHGAISGQGTLGGGGIFVDSARSLTLGGDVITGNSASVRLTRGGGGGGVYVNGGTLTVSNSAITGNSATFTRTGGASNGGGGIYDNGGAIAITGSDVSNNTVNQTGTTNSGSDGGGGIYSNGGDVDVTGSSVNANTDNVDSTTSGSDGGGGIYDNGGTVSLATSSVDGNTFTLDAGTAGSNGGGGVYSNGGGVSLISSSLDANTSNVTDTSSNGSDGGGGAYSNNGNVSAILSSVSQNSARVDANGNGNGGGAIFDGGGTGLYLTSTLSSNSVTLSGSGTQSDGGGAIYSTGGGLISNVTIAGNGVNAPGGALFLPAGDGTFDLKDTIVAANGAGNCAGGGTFTSAGFNLESANTCGFTATGDQTNTDPRLGSLQNNGGQTLTRALLAGSPAVDTGSCTDILGNALTVDQRGVSRPQPAAGNCDIGAFELQAPLVRLPFIACYDPGTPGCIHPFAPSGGTRADVVAMTADGMHLYVAGPSVVYHYTRDVNTGALTLHDCIDEGNADSADCTAHFPGTQLPLQHVNAMALSTGPQQQDLYVAGSSDGSTGDRAIVHLHRDPATGALSFGECIAAIAGDTCANSFGTSSDGRASMSDLKVTADGKSVLATSVTFGAELLNLDRDVSTGALTMRQCFTFSNNNAAANCTNVTSSPTACSTNPIDLNGLASSPDDSDVYVATSQCDHGAVLHFARAGNRDLSYQNCIGFSNSSNCASGTLPGDASGSQDSIAFSPDGELYLGVGASASGESAAIVHVRRVTTAGATHGDLSFGNCVSWAGNAPCGAWLPGAPGGTGAVVLAGFSSDGQSIYATLPGYRIDPNPTPVSAGIVRLARDNSPGATHGDVGALTNCFATNNSAATYPPCSHPPGSVTADIVPAARGGVLSPDDRQLYVPTGAGWGDLIQLGVVSASATTGAATNLTESSAQLNGSANPNGGSTTYHFEYGTTRSYGSSAPVPDAPVGSDNTVHAESQTISGLSPGTTYHFRIVANNGTVITFGSDQTFSTAASAGGPGSGPPPSPLPPAPSPGSPPAAVPGAPAATSSTAAAFSGMVNPEGQVTTVFFQYGLDARYRPGGGSAVTYDQSTPPQTLPADSSVHAVSQSASGLVPNAVYHVRLVAVNAAGSIFGPDQTFTTPAGPPPPPPVLGQSVNGKPVSGRVFLLVGTTLVPLTQATRLPSGAIVDARAGSLQLTAGLPGHKRETGVFGGAIFKLTQARTGLTSLALVEGAFPGAPSYASCRPPRAADARAAALSSRTLQLLHASAHGKFRTSGRYSAATVRGTKWTVADRCDGTFTHDLTDSVAVTDLVRHRSVVLHAGQTYLAKAPARK